ncbi:hypothetical protein CDO52_22320 [Nocardiopsis gilva YIM 90087]|uniref:Uncharacterized protein n=1 Tax=Nocardiopsis gilva YIM 90087 TaxID=1235441 RepID=A0A223SAK2_9ACTN|nr:hypothetical protein [Nocardiopsis gilva]ASU85161.1 hypothetical protein CDO52_22320 [Nocardiopsis gilva YIM 90087]
MVLDYKYGEPDAGGDGLLARWHTWDIAALFMDWVWRRGGTAPPTAEEVGTAIRVWWSMLAEQGWLDPRCSHVDDLRTAVDAFAVSCRAAFGQPVLFAGPGRNGYRKRAARLPTAAKLAEAIRAVPAFRRDEDGDGARPARDRAFEASPWVPRAAMQLWREFYEAISEDLPERLYLADQETFEKEYGVPPDAFVEGVLSVLFSERRPVAIPFIARSLLRADEQADEPDERWDDTSDESAARLMAIHVVLDDLERLGAIARSEPEPGGCPEAGVVFGLTSVGEWAAYERLTAAGQPLRTFNALMAEEAEVLVERAAGGAPGTAADLDAWIAARGTKRAMRDLVDVARRTDDCLHRALVGSVTTRHPHAAAAAYERLTDDPDFGPQARMWLHDRGLGTTTALRPGDRAWVTVDQIAEMIRLHLMTDDRARAVSAPRSVDGVSFFDVMSAIDHPQAGSVLHWFELNHPDRAARLHARDALGRLSPQRHGQAAPRSGDGSPAERLDSSGRRDGVIVPRVRG